MTEKKSRFDFKGDVYAFGRIIEENVHIQTVAATRERAISNIKYRLRKERNLYNTIPLDLDGYINDTENRMIHRLRA